MDITVYGPRSELHSGHYGNWAPNPAMLLARLLASMKDESRPRAGGRFLRGHRAAERHSRSGPSRTRRTSSATHARVLARRHRGRAKKLVELITLPSLNIRGMASSRIGAQASNVIPSTATATIDIRLAW